MLDHPIAPVQPAAVLLVEYDPFVLRIVEIVLNREGFLVIPTHNGQQALAAFLQRRHDLTLMLVSVEAPGMNGLDFVERIPTLNPRIPVVFTATQNERDLPSLVKKGYPVLYKPFTPTKLVKSIRAAMPNRM